MHYATIPFTYEDEMLEALGKGELDVALATPATIGYYNMTHKDAPVTLVLDYESMPELHWEVAVGMRKADDALAAAINEATRPHAGERHRPPHLRELRHRGESTRSAVEIVRAHAAFFAWRSVPPPWRGQLIRLLGEELRAAKEVLGRLVTIETCKILSEGRGEVQEMIDICEFAVGLSRQIYGLTIATERPDHRMTETWHPLGVCGVISAFNFPVTVWSWNAPLALTCGDPVVWKPSEKRRSQRLKPNVSLWHMSVEHTCRPNVRFREGTNIA